MSNIIPFPPNRKNERDLPFLRLHDSLPELIERTMTFGLIASCSLVNASLSLYLTVVRLPNGTQAHFEQPEDELKNFLNGLILGYLMAQKEVQQ